MFFLFFTFDLLFPFPVLSLFLTPHIVSRSKLLSYFISSESSMRGPNNNTHFVHDAGQTLIKNKTASKRHSTWMSSWPELQSGGKKIYRTWSFTEKLAAHPRSVPMSNLYIQWDLTWGVQGLWRRIAAKGPHSVQERKSSESWLETRKEGKEWNNLEKGTQLHQHLLDYFIVSFAASSPDASIQNISPWLVWGVHWWLEIVVKVVERIHEK